MSPRQPKVGALAVVWNRGAVLLVRRANPPQAGQWGFPGGHLEHGESLRQCALRELAEETGVRGRPQAVLPAVELIEESAHFVLVPVRIAYAGGEPAPRTDALEASWFSPEALPTPLCRDVDRVIEESRPARRALA